MTNNKHVLSDNELYRSTENAIKERLGSVTYGTFVISWFGLNWEIIYITFFIDQNIILKNTGLIKLDYLYSFYLLNSLSDIFLTSFKLFWGPMLFTYIIIWLFSKIDFICARKHYSNKFKKEEEQDRQRELLLNKKISVSKKEIDNLTKKQEVTKKEKEVRKEMTDEQKWGAEIKNISDIKMYKETMQDLEVCLYGHNGELAVAILGGYDYKMSPQNLSFLDINELINFVDKTRSRIEVTKKGKFFLKEAKNLKDKEKDRYN